MATIRAFIAVTLPETVQEYLDKFGATLAEAIPTGAVRWVDSDKIHLTVRFLGDTETKILPDVVSVMDQLSDTQEPFHLQLGKFGCFPNPRRPRVLWVGLGGQIERLQALHNSLAELLQPIGWQPERRSFHPHLTIGRVKDSHRLKGVPLNWGEVLEPRSIHVNALHLIESRLFQHGPVYTPRHTSHFSDSDDTPQNS